ncbi:MAG TPA: hypothetical protein PLK90_09415 [Clostridiales bacterium]|nr:hypothetical protein [Clostridiales bacterium]HQP70604.1 hypothetical protein [Clostridiales bacterium]
MKKLTSLIILLAIIQAAWAGSQNYTVRTDTITFRSAVWDNTFNMFYMKNNISDLTKRNTAVVLYFFDICWG